jgi:probable rRNA maturation factor
LVILRKQVAGLTDTALAKFVSRASRAVGLRGVVNVLVTGNRELRALNRRFRGKDKPTDVLSFAPEPFISESALMNRLAGDIAISAEIAKQNARRLDHSAAQEIKVLTLHGVLHLAGYDHDHDQGAMARKETAVRQSLGLPVGLIERNGRFSKATARKDARTAERGPVRKGPFNSVQASLRTVSKPSAKQIRTR